jgi:hypothetical protein
VEQTATADTAVHHSHRPETPAEVEQFDRTAQTGWNFFTRFLLWNVLAIAGILLFIGLFTVWS